MDQLIKLALEIGAAVFAGWATNEVVKTKTGRSIPQHLSEWWHGVNYEISQWVHNHQHLKITKIVVAVFTPIDKLVSTALVKMSFKAKTPVGEEKITERTLSAKEVREMFPGLENEKEVPIEISN